MKINMITKFQQLRNFITLFSVLFIFFTNCSPTTTAQKIANDGITEIDIISNLSKTRKVNLSEITSSIEYIALETDRKCLVSGISAYCSKEYVITIGGSMDLAACYVFERGTGKFVRQISSYGRGPGEYTEINGFLGGEKEQVRAWGNNQHIFFNLDGTLSHRINRFSHYMDNFIAHGDFYAGYVNNRFGNSTVRIAFYDQTGALVDSIPEYRTWERTQTSYSGGGYGYLYIFDDNLYFKELFCDTLYHIKESELHPRYLFNTGGRAVPYKEQEGGRYDILPVLRGGEPIDRFEKYVNITKILESNRHLYFTVDYRRELYPAIYDKIENKIQIMPPIANPIPGSRESRERGIVRYGFENDLDGGLPF